jgi:hypothetical protein
MKLNCGETRQAKIKRLEQWHDWFAWHPVRLGENHCRWLETIQRKGSLKWGEYPDEWWEWEYKKASEK